MNRQQNGTKRGIEWTGIYGLPGYTSNPIKGCKHKCQWRMPNGKIAVCYAKDVAEGIARHAFPGGFEALTWHPDELRNIEKHQNPCGIFIDSMSDLFGATVKKEWIDEVLKTVRKCPQHIFFSLTKNPVRFKEFDLPENLFCGISSPPTFMYGKELTPQQQLETFRTWIRMLGRSTATVRWISFEPLSFDVTDAIDEYWESFHWAVIGAASDASKHYQPDRVVFSRAVERLDAHNIPIFFKGNIERNFAISVAGRWREDFPPQPTKLEQADLSI
jgi:protein gp37